MGSYFTIKCVSLKPEFKLKAYGAGHFQCDEFTYDGNFSDG